VTGIGERIGPMPGPRDGSQVVLAHPPFTLSTAAVFAELRATDWGAAAERGRNDLLAPAVRLQPAIQDVMRLMIAAGGAPQLTGSGPTVFATTDDPERAAAMTARLRRGGLRATHTRLRSEPARIEAVEEPEE
jgi:4-diphosphocytidyl-2C-methyl-D-erythritol kinase